LANDTKTRPQTIALTLTASRRRGRLHDSSHGRRRCVPVAGIVHARNMRVEAIPTTNRVVPPRMQLRECAADKRFQDDSSFWTADKSITASYVG